METLESPCPDLPVADIVVRVTASDGSVAAEPVTDAQGRFEVTVDAGEYVVEPVVEGGGVASAKPQTVTVVGGEFVEVTLIVDTGIREGDPPHRQDEVLPSERARCALTHLGPCGIFAGRTHERSLSPWPAPNQDRRTAA